jgi:hypothetical protein
MPDKNSEVFSDVGSNPITPIPVVDITNPTFQSERGKYFVGRTDDLTLIPGYNAWAAVMNPSGSDVNLFFNVFTLSNYTQNPYLAQIIFNATPPGSGTVSNHVSPGNTELSPLPIPRSQIQFAQGVTGFPQGGVGVLNRVISAFLTDKAEYDGRFIFPPSGSLVIFLTPLGTASVTANVAFGWWEKPCV